jgi:hypothetical protein
MTEAMAMNDFLWGGISVTCAAIGLCFLRFWTDTHDRFFIFFAVAFGLLSLNWFLLELFQPPSEARHYFYLIRLAAFAVIITGIVDKNVARRRH